MKVSIFIPWIMSRAKRWPNAPSTTLCQLQAEPPVSDVQLFLDPAGLVEDIAGHATKLAWNIPLDPSHIPSGDNGVMEFDPPDDAPKVIGRPRDIVGGLTLEIDRGTEIGVGDYVCGSKTTREFLS